MQRSHYSEGAGLWGGRTVVESIGLRGDSQSHIRHNQGPLGEVPAWESNPGGKEHEVRLSECENAMPMVRDDGCNSGEEGRRRRRQ